MRLFEKEVEVLQVTKMRRGSQNFPCTKLVQLEIMCYNYLEKFKADHKTDSIISVSKFTTYKLETRNQCEDCLQNTLSTNPEIRSVTIADSKGDVFPITPKITRLREPTFSLGSPKHHSFLQ